MNQISSINFLQLILVLAILIVVGVPLFGKLSKKKLYSKVDPSAEEFKHLLVRKEEVLLAIKEIQFDYQTEKLSDADYTAMKRKLETEALALMDKIDALEKDLKKKRKHVDAA